ncbi:MAG: hypothetical protein ACYC6N_08530 [Pirellulaceae bacterium]
MSEKKPTPVVVAAKGKACPVCGQRSYSWGGIHPQCAMVLADAPRRMCLAAERKAAAQSKAQIETPKSRLWEKTCPDCGSQVPARRSVCECGHAFSGK